MPSVSIVINNYNYARYLGAAIESALEQTHPGVEVVVVDDGSTDESREIIARYEGELRAIYQENQGQAAAWNRGLEEGRGEGIVFPGAGGRRPRADAEAVRAPRRP